jgi:predicted dehydrogenase
MHEARGLRVALVGAGNIATRYARRISEVDGIELAGASDLRPERAQTLVAEFGGRAYASLDEVLADDAVDVVVNLTLPTAHAEVTQAALEAGKHVHSEKPVALRYEEAHALAELAAARGVRLSCAPATLLGEAQQTAWKVVRDGGIGTVCAVYAEANWGRLERWHPSPEGLYVSGPLLDVGIYPLTILTAMLGPVRRVTAFSTMIEPERTRQDGGRWTLETPDFWVAALELDGVVARLTASFWVPPSRQRGLELHGEEGSLWLPTWGESNSRLLRTRDGEEWEQLPLLREPYDGIDWGAALLDLRSAIEEGRPHRMGAEHAAHVVEVLNAAHRSSRDGGPVSVESTFDAPPPLDWAL